MPENEMPKNEGNGLDQAAPQMQMKMPTPEQILQQQIQLVLATQVRGLTGLFGNVPPDILFTTIAYITGALLARSVQGDLPNILTLRRYGNAEVLGKSKGKVAIALRIIKDRERAFERNARICKISSKPVRGTVEASSDAGFGRPRPDLDFAFDNFGDVPHRRQFAAHKIPDPEAVIDRERVGRGLNAGG
jgi:hypothetical protein